MFIFLHACRDTDKTIDVYQVKKTSSEEVAPRQKKEFTWIIPQDWVESEGNSIRIGSFKFFGKSNNDAADLSVVILSASGGGLVANINRWRGQLELNPLSDSQVMKEVISLKGKLGVFKTTFIKNTKSNNGILGAIFSTEEKTLFVKALGSLEVLKLNQEKFNDFVGSINVAP